MREQGRFHVSGRMTAAALAAAALVAIGLFALSGSATARRTRSAQAGTTGTTGTTVHVIEHAVTDTVVHPGGGSADKTGNLLTFHNQVFDPTDTKAVGRDQGTCIRINPHNGSWECTWTTFLPLGQVTVEGPYYDTKNSVLAITGGTGAYSTARGQMELNSRNGGKEYDFIFHFSH